MNKEFLKELNDKVKEINKELDDGSLIVMNNKGVLLDSKLYDFVIELCRDYNIIKIIKHQKVVRK